MRDKTLGPLAYTAPKHWLGYVAPSQVTLVLTILALLTYLGGGGAVLNFLPVFISQWVNCLSSPL